MSIGVSGRQFFFKHPKTKVNTMFWLRKEQLEVFYNRMKAFVAKAEQEGDAPLVNEIGTDWVQGLDTFARDKELDQDVKQKATSLRLKADGIIMDSLSRAKQKQQDLMNIMQDEQENDRPEFNWQPRDNGEIVSAVPVQTSFPWLLIAALGIGGLVAYKFIKK